MLSMLGSNIKRQILFLSTIFFIKIQISGKFKANEQSKPLVGRFEYKYFENNAKASARSAKLIITRLAQGHNSAPVRFESKTRFIIPIYNPMLYY